MQSLPSEGPAVDKGSFRRYVQEALENLYDPGRLATSPLASILSPHISTADVAGVDAAGTRATGTDVAATLREFLRETIESLRPDASIPFSRTEWFSYRLLSLLYVHSRSPEAIARELGISRATYYRYREEALDIITEVIWNASQANPGSRTSTSSSSAREKVIQMARQAPMAPVRLSEVMRRVRRLIEPLAAECQVPLKLTFPDPLATIRGDPAMIRQAILTLLTMAMRFATPKGLTLSAHLVSGEVQWCLSGISQHQGDIGELEGTSEYQLSKALLEIYGGRLWWVPDDAACVTLFFALPVTDPKTILIVDDDPDTIQLYTRFLREWEYIVRPARNATETRMQLDIALPDLILLDVLMPREDGWDILEELKSSPATAHIPVVVCSVLPDPSLALSLGAAQVLQKPITKDALAETLATLLARADSTA